MSASLRPLPTALQQTGNGHIALVFPDGAVRPIAGVRLRPWSSGPGGYTGFYASWGLATLYAAGEDFHLDVCVVWDSDGGERDEDHVCYVSHDGGKSWRPLEGDRPAGATELATFRMPRTP